MKHLIIIEHDNSNVKAASLPVITAANKASNQGNMDCLVIGHQCHDVAQQAAKIAGITCVKHVDSPEYKDFIAENIVNFLMTIKDDYDYFWAPADSFGKDFIPRFSALINVQQIADITQVFSATEFERPIYAGNALCHIQTSQTKNVITVRGTSFEDADDTSGNALIETVNPYGDAGKTEFVKIEASSLERPELTSAKIVVSGGRGLQSGENFVMLEKVADILGAAVGASRAAVDAGYVPNDYQVGQTGKVVAPDLYIAVGISGAIQHLAGMKDSKIIVAINKDEDAPIFQVADYGLVADLFEAVPALEQALQA